MKKHKRPDLYELNLTADDKKALHLSIRHWEKDVVKMFKDGWKIRLKDNIWEKDKQIKTLLIGEKNCALCNLYIADCRGCPLSEATGRLCSMLRSPYRKFIHFPTLKNAEAMVDTLETILAQNYEGKRIEE